MAEKEKEAPDYIEEKSNTAFMNQPYHGVEDRVRKDEEELKALENERTPEPEEASKPKEDAEPNALGTEKKQEDSTDWKKRYSDLRRHLTAKENEFKAELDKINNQLQAASKEKMDLPTSEEDVEAWIREYPEIAGIVRRIAVREYEDQSRDIREKTEALAREREQTKYEQAEHKLRQEHPDLEDIKVSEDFHAWVAEQPEWIANSLYRNTSDWKAAARAIDLYKADQEKARRKNEPEKKPNRAQAAMDEAAAAADIAPARRTSDPSDHGEEYFKESDIAKMNPAVYERMAEKIEKAYHEGRIVLDVSRPNG